MSGKPDILIVGAGVIGCALARELARAGAAVAVLEAAPDAATEASGAAAGILNYALSAKRPAQWHGLGRLCLAEHHTLEEQLKQETGLAPDWHWRGLIRVADSAKNERRVRRDHDCDAANNFAAEWLDDAQLRRLEPQLAREFYCGCYYLQSGRVDPRRLTLALADSARQAGAKFLFGQRVEAIEFAGRRIAAAVTGREKFSAGYFVNAAGAWSATLVPQAAREVYPVRGQALRLATNELPLIEHIIMGGGVYLAPDGDGVIVGATQEDAGFDKANTAGGIDKLLRGALKLAPCLGRCDWRRTEMWSGLRPATRDKVPLIGPDPRIRNLWWATGHYTHGVLFAPLTAKLIRAGLIDADNSDLFTTGRR